MVLPRLSLTCGIHPNFFFFFNLSLSLVDIDFKQTNLVVLPCLLNQESTVHKFELDFIKQTVVQCIF